MRLEAACVLLLVFGPVPAAVAQTAAAAPPPPPPPLTGSVSAGLALTSGNTNTSSYNASLSLGYVKNRNTLKVDALLLRGRSNGVLNVDRKSFSATDQVAMTPKAFAFAQVQYLGDRFKNIDYLVSPTLGLGYKFVATASTTLSGEAGAGGVWEKDLGLPVDVSGAVNASQRLKLRLSQSANVTEAVTGLWDTNAFANALYTFAAGIELAVTHKLQVKIEFLDTYKNRPPAADIKKNDESTILSLVYKFAGG
jgi:putative salt-induced outer membrane protein YdiY